MTDPAALAVELARIVARDIGPSGEISQLRRLTGGATKETWSFIARIGDEQRPLVLQVTRARETRNEHDPLGALPRVIGRDDAVIMQAAGRAGVPVTPVRAVLDRDSPLGEGHIADLVMGETIARRILREPAYALLRENFATQCGEVLARIHAMQASALPFLQPSEATRQIATYKRIYESFDLAVPALDLAFRWAEDHLPAAARTSVVHGDFRMGNLICNAERIAAVLDWELACTGDPMQDLGWLCVKTWRFGGRAPVGGIGRREDLFAAYSQVSGHAVEAAHVRFWEAWGSVKWGVMCLMKGQAHRRTARERTVEAFAIGRRMEEPIHDFLNFLAGKG